MARLEPTSRVIAKGCSITRPLPARAGCIRRCCGRQSPARGARRFLPSSDPEQMGEAPLRLQIVLDRNLPADLAAAGDGAVFGFEHREQPALDGEPRQTDGVVRGRAPAERARHVDVDIARAVNAHRLDDLALEIVQVGDGRGRDIGNAVSDGDFRHALAGAEDVAGLLAHGRRGRGARGRRRRRGALHAGVHIGFVVVTNVEHVIVALEHAGQAAETDIGGAAVAALRDGAHLGPPFHPHGGGNAGGDRRGIAEQRMQPGRLPRRFRIGRGEHFQTAGGVDGDRYCHRSRAWPHRWRSARPTPRRSPGRRDARRSARWSGRSRPAPRAAAPEIRRLPTVKVPFW